VVLHPPMLHPQVDGSTTRTDDRSIDHPVRR
jgi:hypothetical protein